MSRNDKVDAVLAVLMTPDKNLNELGREVYIRLNALRANMPLDRICPVCSGRYSIADESTECCASISWEGLDEHAEYPLPGFIEKNY